MGKKKTVFILLEMFPNKWFFYIYFQPISCNLTSGVFPVIVWPQVEVATGQTTGNTFRRICLKIEQNCRLFWGIFSCATMDDLSMIFTSRLKVDAKCAYQQWNWITVANYFGTPPADWIHEYLYFEPGAWIWTKGFRRYLHIVKNWSGNLSLNSTRVRALGWPFEFFSGFFI